MLHYVHLFDIQNNICFYLLYPEYYLSLFRQINVMDLRKKGCHTCEDSVDYLKIFHSIIRMILYVLLKFYYYDLFVRIHLLHDLSNLSNSNTYFRLDYLGDCHKIFLLNQ